MSSDFIPRFLIQLIFYAKKCSLQYFPFAFLFFAQFNARFKITS